jgi:hypothetical protein
MKLFGALLALALFALVPAVASANSLDVTVDAAMGPSSSSACGVAGAGCGLEVIVINNDNGAVFVRSEHMQDEPAFNLSFYIDPKSPAGTFTIPPGQNVRVGRVFEGFITNGVRLVLFLKASTTNAAYRFAMYSRKNPAAGAGSGFEFVGEGYVTGLAATTPTRVDIEVTPASSAAASDGQISATRTLDLPGAPTETIFNNTVLKNGDFAYNIADFGMISASSPNGTFGPLALDEFVITRP